MPTSFRWAFVFREEAAGSLGPVVQADGFVDSYGFLKQAAGVFGIGLGQSEVSSSGERVRFPVPVSDLPVHRQRPGTRWQRRSFVPD
jgi:hypothetical protein